MSTKETEYATRFVREAKEALVRWAKEKGLATCKTVTRLRFQPETKTMNIEVFMASDWYVQKPGDMVEEYILEPLSYSPFPLRKDEDKDEGERTIRCVQYTDVMLPGKKSNGWGF
jgi:hypothetical protein